MVDPFNGEAADLEPLPPATGDLWDRIVKGYAIPDLEGPLVGKHGLQSVQRARLGAQLRLTAR